MTLRPPITALILVILGTACIRPPDRHVVAKPKGGGIETEDQADTSEPSGVSSADGGASLPSTDPVDANFPSEIILANAKFTGEENKLQASVVFGGVTNSSLNLTAKSDGVLITIPSLPTNKADTLVVEIYQDKILRFIARRANTLVEKGKVNTWTLEDCDVTRVPWDGEDNQGICGWSIEDNK